MQTTHAPLSRMIMESRGSCATYCLLESNTHRLARPGQTRHNYERCATAFQDISPCNVIYLTTALDVGIVLDVTCTLRYDDRTCSMINRYPVGTIFGSIGFFNVFIDPPILAITATQTAEKPRTARVPECGPENGENEQYE